MLKIQLWTLRLLNEYYSVHKVPLVGALFRAEVTDARPASIAQLDVLFHQALEELQEDRPDILAHSIDVQRDFSVKRSLRRTSNTHARNQEIDSTIIVSNNRWRKIERAKRRDPSADMIELYSDVVAGLDYTLRYSRDM